MPSWLLLAGLLLAGGFAGSAVLLVHEAQRRRLFGRLASLALAEAQVAIPAAPSIRILQAGKWHRRAAKLFALPTGEMQTRLPPRLVPAVGAAAGMALGLFAAPRWGLTAGVVLAVVACFGFVRFEFMWERRRWRATLLAQVPDVIGLVCSMVRSGLPLPEAVHSVAREAAQPSRVQFVRVTDEMRIGRSLEAALWGVHNRTGVAEYGFLAVTVGLQTETGGSLLETLENLQEMVRRRVATARRGKALASEARTSALILELLPFVAGAVMQFVNPGYFTFFLDTPSGNRLLAVAAGLFVTGVLSIQMLIARSLSE